MTLNKRNIIDYIISSAVLLQSVLVIIELYWVDVVHMDEELATTYRVYLTAIPMSVALLLSGIRRPLLFLCTYFGAAIIFLLSVFFFPETQDEALHLGSRFTFPLVIGSALCLASVDNLAVINKTLYWLSYITAAFALVYFYKIYTMLGGFSVTDYNMSFSYALLLPAAALYAQKKPVPMLVAAGLFLMIVLMGSRGAAVFLVLYVFLDLVKNNKKILIPTLILSALVILLLPVLAIYLDSLGIESRTITSLMESDKSGHDSGRIDMYIQMLRVLEENWFTGIGLFGDRLYLDVYCHNLFLEVLLNFGMIFGTIILLLFGWSIMSVYHQAEIADKNVLLLYFMATVCPLLVSHSYLTDYNFGIFIGILICVAAHNRQTLSAPLTP